MRGRLLSRKLRLRGPALALLTLLAPACTPQDEPLPLEQGGFPPPAEGAERWQTPELLVPAGSERFWCMAGTLPDDVGVDALWQWTDSRWMHHQLVKRAPPDLPYEDGEVVDCLDLGEWWGPAPTLFEGVGDLDDEDEREVALPPGSAFLIQAGQRFVFDSHFVNTGEEDEYAVVAVDMHFVDPSTVEHPVGSFNHDVGGGLLIPPGLHTETFDCVWEQDVSLLALGPHMHDHGREYSIDLVSPDGTVERLVHVDPWDPDFLDEPPMRYFALGELPIAQGQAFRTTCTWDNDSGHDLGFPDEMCTTFGVAAGLLESLLCEPQGPPPQ